MYEDIKGRLKQKSKPVEFKQTKGLLSATTLGLGSLMGAGLYVLVGIAAKEAGPSLWIAYAICGLLTFLSVLMFAELSRNLPISGGGYVYAYDQLGSFWGFIVGWHLAVGSMFACALYAVGFSSYALEFIPPSLKGEWSSTSLSVLIVAALVLVGLVGGKGGDRIQKIFTWGNLAILLILVVVALPASEPKNFTPSFPKGVAGIGSAISLIYISFFGYQLVANSAEETRNPTKTVPRAMKLSMFLALCFYVVVSVVSVAAVNWKVLSESEAPLALVAEKGFGRWGVVIVGIGGILASISALNGTLLSQGRQIYAMGRDRLLPEVVGRISEKNRIPTMAVLAGGAGTILAIVLADLSFIAKAANFSLLFSMLPISFALRRIQKVKNSNERKFTIYQRAVPIAALLANGGLLLTLDWYSLMFGGTIVTAGCLMFFGYSYSSEKRGKAGFSVSLSDSDNPFDLLNLGERILVPMANPRTQQALFSISHALLPPEGGEIVVLNVFQSANPRQALQSTQSSLEAVRVIERAIELADKKDVTFRPVVRAAKSLAEGIRHAVIEERARLLVMGWSAKEDSSPSKLLEDVISRVKTNSIFLKLDEDASLKRVGVSLGGTGNLPLMVRLASRVAEQYGGEVTYINVVPEYFDKEHLRHARRIQVEAIGRHTSMVPFHTEVLRSDNPFEALVARSKSIDLLVVGAAHAMRFDTNIVGGFSSMIADKAHCSVIIVRQSRSLGLGMRSSLKTTSRSVLGR